MTSVLCIVMTKVMEHFSDNGMEHCDDKGDGELRRRASRSIVITGVMEYWDDMSMDLVMTRVMEYFDDKSPGSLCCQGSWSIVITVVMEHCDDRGHGAL